MKKSVKMSLFHFGIFCHLEAREMYKNEYKGIETIYTYTFPESPICTFYDDTKRFLSNWGRTRCKRNAQGLEMANCTSFKILTHI